MVGRGGGDAPKGAREEGSGAPASGGLGWTAGIGGRGRWARECLRRGGDCGRGRGAGWGHSACLPARHESAGAPVPVARQPCPRPARPLDYRRRAGAMRAAAAAADDGGGGGGRGGGS